MKDKIDRVNELCRRDGVYKNLTTGRQLFLCGAR